MKKQYPTIAAIAYAIMVGLSFLITKLVVPFASPILILAHRFTIAFITYAFFLIITKQKLQLNREKIIAILPATLFYPLIFFSLQLYGLTRASSAEAGIIFATVPILTIVIATLLGKRPSLIQIVCVLLSVSGVIYIVSQNMTASSGSGNVLGLLLLFISALSFAIYVIGIGKILSVASIHELTIVLITMGFIVFNLMFIIQTASMQKFATLYTVPFKSLSYTLGIIYLGTFASVMASLFSNYALKTLSAAKFSVFSNLSTFISISAGALILKEQLYMYHYIGGALILTGVIGTNFSGKIEGYFEAVLNS